MHVVQLMALPLTVSCFSKIQIGFTFLVPAHLVVPDKGPLNGCVCVCVCVFVFIERCEFGPAFFRSCDFVVVSTVLTVWCDIGVSAAIGVQNSGVSVTSFYPRDAMLARVLAMTLCPCLCPCLSSRCCIKMNERISLLFGTQASFDQSYTVI